MRLRLLALVSSAVLVGLVSGTGLSRAGTAGACTATATGKHVRTQLLKVHLGGTCPVSGVAHGTLTFSQWPRIHADGVFALDYAAGTLWLRVPRKLSMKPAWSAHVGGAGLDVSVTASPRRRLSDRGRYSINGGFKASNGAVVRWKQTVSATPNRITLGSVHVSASLPGTRSMVVAVHEVRQFCATNRTCPFGMKTTTDRVAFPAAYTHVAVSSPLWFVIGAGTLLSGREQTTILLRSKRTGRILGRSDFQALVRID
jgi:hypothetical protein